MLTRRSLLAVSIALLLPIGDTAAQDWPQLNFLIYHAGFRNIQDLLQAAGVGGQSVGHRAATVGT